MSSAKKTLIVDDDAFIRRALDVLTKPYSPSDLIRRVREVPFDSGDNDEPEP